MVELCGGKAAEEIVNIEKAGGEPKSAGQKAEADIGMGKKGKIPAGNEGEKDWGAEEEEIRAAGK